MSGRARWSDTSRRRGSWLGSLIAVSAYSIALAQTPAGPPATRRDNVTEVVHDVTIVDPYRWLEDQESPETRAWIDAQNAFADSLIGNLPGRGDLQRRLTELLRIDVTGVPTERGGRYFFTKRRADQELHVISMRVGLSGPDEMLIDPHPMSPDRTTSVGIEDVSLDGRLLAYTIRRGGEDETEIHLFDVDARQDLPDRLPRARYFGLSLTADASGFYYTRHGEEGSRVYYHRLGGDPAGDAYVFGEGYGPEKIVFAGVSEDGRYLLIHVMHGAAGDRTEIYCQDLEKRGPVVPIVGDLDARFFGSVAGNRLVIQTNWKAARGRILAADLADPARERWREIVPEGEGVIEWVSPAGGALMVGYTESASSRLKVFDPEGRALREIALPAIGSVSGVSGRWTSGEAFFTFTSFHIPPTVYRYDLATGSQDVWTRLEVPVRSEEFEVKQVWYESKDGTKVPMFLLHRQGIALDGGNPALLTGYGGFNASMTPYFSSFAALWAERGAVWAVPNLRGGGEFGEEWHRAGMRGEKQNVFDDFIAAAEWLIRSGYTRAARLAISGGSNGGLLVGAALTQRPDLFQAVICTYPLLDMLRYHRFLVAPFWVSEYGSADDPDQFRYLHAYSPYHRVTPGTDYPAVLFMTGDSDTRVDPLHARKMAALLQSATGSDRPVLLHYDTKAGHSGGKPLSKQIEDLTDELAFLFWQLGVRPGGE